MRDTYYSQFSLPQRCTKNDVLTLLQKHCILQLQHVACSINWHSEVCPVLVLQAELSVSYRH